MHCLRGGEALAAQPGEVHSTGQLPNFPGRLYWFQLCLPRQADRLLGLDPGDTQALAAALRKLPRQFRVAPHMRHLFDATLRSDEQGLSAALRAVAFKARMLQLLIACIESAKHGSEQTPVPPAIARALQSMQDESSANLKVTALAKAGRLSESYFKALFRATIGMPSAEFLRVLRLERAQLRLRNTSASITEVALATGFASSQHFATAFRKQYGCSPRTFRRHDAAPTKMVAPLRGTGARFHPVQT